jgi:hypothetical protein
MVWASLWSFGNAFWVRGPANLLALLVVSRREYIRALIFARESGFVVSISLKAYRIPYLPKPSSAIVRPAFSGSSSLRPTRPQPRDH